MLYPIGAPYERLYTLPAFCHVTDRGQDSILRLLPSQGPGVSRHDVLKIERNYASVAFLTWSQVGNPFTSNANRLLLFFVSLWALGECTVVESLLCFHFGGLVRPMSMPRRSDRYVPWRTGKYSMSVVALLCTVVFTILLNDLYRHIIVLPLDVGRVQPFDIPDDETPDVFMRFPTSTNATNETVRVMLMVVGTRVNPSICGHIASAYLTNLPVVVVGYKHRHQYSHKLKMQFYQRAIRQAGLKGSDVVVLLDGDTTFTGVDLRALLADYVNRSAATVDDLDALAVREGRAEPPFLVSAEFPCYAGSSHIGKHDRCVQHYQRLYHDMAVYAMAHNMTILPNRMAGNNPVRHLNNGIVVARVWAVHVIGTAMSAYMKRVDPDWGESTWWCDQSVMAGIFFDLIYWEMNNNMYRSHLEPMHRRQRSTYGVPAGTVALDTRALFSFPPRDVFELSTEAWNCTTPSFPQFQVYDHLYESESLLKSFDNNITQLYRQCEKRSVERDSMQLPRSRHPHHKSLDLAPPIYSIVPRPDIDTLGGRTERVFPAIVHFAGDYDKWWAFQRSVYLTRWGLPILNNASAYERATAILRSMPLELWGVNRYRVPFITLCEPSTLF